MLTKFKIETKRKRNKMAGQVSWLENDGAGKKKILQTVKKNFRGPCIILVDQTELIVSEEMPLDFWLICGITIIKFLLWVPVIKGFTK